MPRYAFRLRVKEEAIERYELEHTRVWPELLERLKELGVSDYSIFRRGQELILVLRVEDFEATWSQLEKDPINQRWQAFMAPLFEPMEHLEPGERFPMFHEIFHLE
jgi:L-rhamnose mutarotase